MLKNRLKKYRTKLNVTQQEMGRLCGVSGRTICLIEQEDYTPTITLALKIAEVCNAKVEDIFYSQKEEKKVKKVVENKPVSSLKFLLTYMSIGMILGCILIFTSNMLHNYLTKAKVNTIITIFSKNVAPWLLILGFLIVITVCIPLYFKEKHLLSKWNGEDDATFEKVEIAFGYLILIFSSVLIISFFLIAAITNVIKKANLNNTDIKTNILLLLSLLFSIITIFTYIIIIAKTNKIFIKANIIPNISVFDLKSAKKLIDNADESEQLVTYKNTYKAYFVTIYVCFFLIAILSYISIYYKAALLALLTVGIITLVGIFVNLREGMKHITGKKVS